MNKLPLTGRKLDGSSRKEEIHPLQEITSNLTLLYIKAKNYHWNVTGSEFPGLHKMFDEMQEGVLEWVDTVAERQRALEIKVDASAECYLHCKWFPEGKATSTASEMKADMLRTLEIISARVCSFEIDCVTDNILQELCAFLDKEAYFVRSSI